MQTSRVQKDVPQESNKSVCVIMSVETKGSKYNSINTADLNYSFLSNAVRFKELKASYKGVKETCFLIDLGMSENIPSNIAYLKSIASSYEQESILILDEHRNASLVYCQGNRVESIGKFKAVSKKDAITQDGWTYDPYNDQYYIIEEA